MTLQTEFEFVLPRGYVDTSGTVHRVGRMRLASALDEIEAIQDPLVQTNEAYLPVVLLNRVITALGDLSAVDVTVIANLFAADLAYLEDIYQRLNTPSPMVIRAVCPACSMHFQLQVAPLDAGQGEEV